MKLYSHYVLKTMFISNVGATINQNKRKCRLEKIWKKVLLGTSAPVQGDPNGDSTETKHF